MKDPNIFIVEDDHFFAQMLKIVLGKNNYTNVQHFESGEACIDHLYTNPDLIILDYNLGSMNGIEVLRKIKSINPNIHVIFLSSQEKMNVAINSLKYGAFDYIEKEPHNVTTLLNLIQKIFKVDQISEKVIIRKRIRNWLKIGLGVTALFILLFLLI